MKGWPHLSSHSAWRMGSFSPQQWGGEGGKWSERKKSKAVYDFRISCKVRLRVPSSAATIVGRISKRRPCREWLRRCILESYCRTCGYTHDLTIQPSASSHTRSVSVASCCYTDGRFWPLVELEVPAFSKAFDEAVEDKRFESQLRSLSF